MFSRELREDLIQFIIAEQPTLLRNYLVNLKDRELLDIRDDMIEDAVKDGRL